MITQKMIDKFINTNLDFEMAPIQDELVIAIKGEFDNMTPNIISALQKRCKKELDEIQYCRNIFRRKKYTLTKETKKKEMDPTFKFSHLREFYEWFIAQPKKCCYCGVPQDQIDIRTNDKSYHPNSPYQRLKRKKRGVSLEIERVITFKEQNGEISYDNVYSKDNCRLACHVCNNAKSDFISVQEFELIARGIHNFWKEKVGIQDIVFPTEVYETFK